MPMVRQLPARYDAAGVSVKICRKPRSDWLALMPNAHEGYVSWEKAETIRKMVSSNVPTSRHHGAPKHGDAFLCAHLHITAAPRADHAQYLASWLAIMKADKKAIFSPQHPRRPKPPRSSPLFRGTEQPCFETYTILAPESHRGPSSAPPPGEKSARAEGLKADPRSDRVATIILAVIFWVRAARHSCRDLSAPVSTTD